jgi:hypothetical protein
MLPTASLFHHQLHYFTTSFIISPPASLFLHQLHYFTTSFIISPQVGTGGATFTPNDEGAFHTEVARADR